MAMDPRVPGGFNVRTTNTISESIRAEMNGLLNWTRMYGGPAFNQQRAFGIVPPGNACELQQMLQETTPHEKIPRLCPLAETRCHIGGVMPEPKKPDPCPIPCRMLPVPICTRCILYKGLCRDLVEGGRCAYLRKRYDDPPAARWPHPPTVNSTYAWPVYQCPNINDVRFPKSGETRRVFFRFSNQHPDTGPQREASYNTCNHRPEIL